MATERIGRLLEQLPLSAFRQAGPGATDGQLLDRFLASRDESAFETLVRRHGPMVLGVCQRVLGNRHDAEDAFQATFLVLVRRAACVRPRERVGNWLHGVAYRTALKARGANARRRARERRAGEARRHGTVQAASPEEWLPLLDEELNRLPEKYRAAVVLCDLEGKARKEAARTLGWPEGTLSGRLARARALLAKRLTQRGLQPSAGVLIALLARYASARPGGSLFRSTVAAGMEMAAGVVGATEVVPARVVALTEGVARAMAKTKLKVMLATLLLAVVLCAGWGALAPTGARARPADDVEDGARPVTRTSSRPDSGRTALLGRWWMTRTASRDKEQAPDAQPRRQANWIITPHKIIALLGNEEITAEYAYEVDNAFTPARLNLIPLGSGPNRGKSLRGIFLLEGDRLKVCHTVPEEDRPMAFTTRRDAPWTLLVFERDRSLSTKKRETSPDTVGGTGRTVGGADEKGAEEVFKTAEFYWRTGNPGAARFMLTLLLRNFPKTTIATKAVERLRELNRLEKEMRGLAPKENAAARIGQIFIVGNTETEQRVILDAVPLTPGARIRLADFREAEKKLAALGLFEVDAAKGVRPTVTVLDAESDSVFKDVLITVQERPAGGRLVHQERAFDLRNRGDLSWSRVRTFKIPFQVDEKGRKLRELRLFASDDQGKSYRLVCTATPDKKTFEFRAPSDGVYWFTVQSVDASGRTFPDEVTASVPGIKVCVDTSAPRLRLTVAGGPKEGRVLARWRVEDENLDLASLKLESRVTDKAAWKSLPIKRIAAGNYVWDVPASTALEVRLRASDLAGNAAERTVQFKPLDSEK